MQVWWESLNTGLQVFYAIGIVSTALLLLQLVLLLIGLELSHDIDADAGGGVLSVKAVTAFFAGFGWTGVMTLEAGLGLPLATLTATGAGATLMGAVVLLMRFLYSLGHSGTLDYRNAVGTVGSVYLNVPAKMSGPGQVEVMIQGRLQVVQAFTRASEAIANQSRVRVVDVLDQNTLIVEPFDGEPAGGTTVED